MKTIFITVFEGVESKNILRTDVLRTLLDDPQVRLVLLMKNQERVDYYRAEFNNPRLIYQVVPEYQQSSASRLDRIFASLKFFLLNTKTTTLRRGMAREERGGSIGYYLIGVLKFMFARPTVRRMVRWLDCRLVRTDRYAKYFDKYRPDLVFLAHLFDEPEIHILREAKHRGIKSIGFVNSWDKVTARAIMRLLPDKTVVFNELVKEQMVTHNEMRAEDIEVTGIPQYDRYYTPIKISREQFFKKIGIPVGNRLMVYAPMGSTFSSSDWDAIDFLTSCIEQNMFGQHASLLVRFQPNDFIDEAELKKRPALHYDYPGKRFAMTRGVDWDMDSADLEHLSATLHFMDVLICYASSVSIDAAVFDKPVINIDFEFKKAASPFKSPTRFYHTAHYTEAIATGGIRLVRTKEELVTWVKKYLTTPDADAAGRKRLVQEQCQFTDGHSGERIGNYIRSQLV